MNKREAFEAWFKSELENTVDQHSKDYMLSNKELCRHVWQAALAAQAQQETVTVQQAWEWAGGNPETKATRQDLEEALKLLDEICEEADKTSPAQQPSCTYTWNCPRCGSGKCIDESDASQFDIRDKKE